MNINLNLASSDSDLELYQYILSDRRRIQVRRRFWHGEYSTVTGRLGQTPVTVGRDPQVSG